MASLRTLCGVLDVPSQCRIHFIGEGLSEGVNYRLGIESNQGPAGDLSDIDVGGANANSAGHVWFAPNPVNFATRTYWLHVLTSQHANRIGSPVTISWGNVAADQAPNYGTPAVLTLAQGHVGLIELDWTPAFGCDPLLSDILYQVRDGAPPPGTSAVVISNRTLSDYIRTGLTGGQSYSHFIRTTFKYVEGLITITNHEPFNSPNFYDSNVLTAVVNPAIIQGQAVLDGSGSMLGTGVRTAIAGAALSGLGEMVASSGPRLVRGGAALSGKGTLLVAGPVVRETWGMIAS